MATAQSLGGFVLWLARDRPRFDAEPLAGAEVFAEREAVGDTVCGGFATGDPPASRERPEQSCEVTPVRQSRSVLFRRTLNAPAWAARPDRLTIYGALKEGESTLIG